MPSALFPENRNAATEDRREPSERAAASWEVVLASGLLAAASWPLASGRGPHNPESATEV